MRVLCSTTPMDGVFGPFIPLGRALADRGHEVLVATGANLRHRVLETGLEFVDIGLPAMDGAIAAMSDAEVRAAPEGDRVAFPSAMFGWVHPNAKLRALRGLAAERRPELIVHPVVDAAGPLLAALLGVPSLCYGFGQPLDDEVVAGISARVRPLWQAVGLDPEPSAGIYRGSYLDPSPPRLRRAPSVQPADRTFEIRPEIPGDPSAPLPEWSSGLGKRPAVYISLGTAPMFNQPQMFAPLLEGLATEQLDLIVTVSELHDPAALGELPESVHVERWLPLAPLLPRCDAVVCHAGTGTTLAALTAGLPMVLVPRGADQFDNARACERAGAARVLMPDQVTAEAVRDAVSAVLAPGSPERVAAKELAGEIAAMPSPSQVAELLETVAIPRDAAV